MVAAAERAVTIEAIEIGQPIRINISTRAAGQAQPAAARPALTTPAPVQTSPPQPGPSVSTSPDLAAFREQLLSRCWVAYAPTNFDPDRRIIPSPASIRADLEVLRQAGFTGLVTYGMEVAADEIARQVGFLSVIPGIWDPTSAAELALAEATSTNPIVLGYVVGNEGLGSRYDMPTLRAAMDRLRQAAGKPVTTTEEWGDYADPGLVTLGDWVFPNVHPYWANITDPQAAAWTAARYHELAARTDQLVIAKEVGLPTAGDSRVSEAAQDEYYRLLAATDVLYVHFEAYDQPWKQWASVEPYWGLFRQDRTPKPAATNVCRAG